MTRYILHILICFFIVVPASAQESDPDREIQELNFDMEDVHAYGRPAVWRLGHNMTRPIVHRMLADSSTKHGGRYSVKLFSNSNRADFASCFIQIPLQTTGKTVILKGFLKTENVNAGLGTMFLALLANDTTVVAYDNMFTSAKALRGTQDWTELTITLAITKDVTKINLGCILEGNGTLWMDDVSLFIDDTKITKAPVLQPYIKDPVTKKLRKF